MFFGTHAVFFTRLRQELLHASIIEVKRDSVHLFKLSLACHKKLYSQVLQKIFRLKIKGTSFSVKVFFIAERENSDSCR